MKHILELPDVGNHDTWKYCEVHLLDADGLEGCAGTGV
jgi:hypothetical protein